MVSYCLSSKKWIAVKYSFSHLAFKHRKSIGHMGYVWNVIDDENFHKSWYYSRDDY